MSATHIEQASTRTLHPHPSNARTHPRKQICQLAQSIRQFGFTVPILADEAGTILAGHARWLAAKELGLKTVPVLVLPGLTDAQKQIPNPRVRGSNPVGVINLFKDLDARPIQPRALG